MIEKRKKKGKKNDQDLHVLWPAGNKGPEIFYTTTKNYNFSKKEKERPRLACAYVAI
jgi:hypothetical protein